MDSYEEELYKYLTQEENFKIIYELKEKFPIFREKLISDFWDILKRKIEQGCKDEWELIFMKNANKSEKQLEIYNGHSFIGIKRQEWANLAIAYEDENEIISLGIRKFFDKDNSNDKIVINKYLNKVSSNNATTLWPYWIYTDINFNEIGTLCKILPERIDQTTSELTDSIFALANKIFEK
jgi:hypothetical protein